MESKGNPMEKSLKYHILIGVSQLVQLLLMTLPLPTESYAIARPGCNDTCGNVQIPYPFGIGPGCFMKPIFELNCTMINGTYRLFGKKAEILEISVSSNHGRIKNPISSLCYINGTYVPENWGYSFDPNGPYRFSHVFNKLTTIGCDTAAYFKLKNKVSDKYRIGCVSGCYNVESLTNESCSGIGCCQTAIPKEINHYEVWFNRNFTNSDVRNFSPCSYAFLVEANWFNFTVNHVTTWELYRKEVPVVVELAFGNGTCETAKLDPAAYVCVSNNSECVDSNNGPGYLCNCSKGYQGNPYLDGGCEDIDECADKDKYPCSKSEVCTNTPGNFSCSCRSGEQHSLTGTCSPEQNSSSVIKLAIGISVSIITLVLVIFCVYVVRERRNVRQVKEDYFRQHGGWLLYDEMRSKQRMAFKIFTKEELEEATNNFDDNAILGSGGYGTVYKGTLKDNRVVAIKKSKMINKSRRKEFGKEILILSQINHKNVVKLLGCCLEVEVPMLVYEFAPNGTLFQLIHGKNNTFHVPFETRLSIAQESAEALAYLHSSASPPIIHGDVKSSNILLDEHYMAKVSDFGASMLAPMDETQFVTLVQGTFGYLDPEYLQKSILTDKSDVYSFGVVLLELLTGKKAICFPESEEAQSLSSIFISAMKANRLHEILNDQIINEEEMELIKEVAELALICLSIRGEERPTMKGVAEELDRLRKLKHHPWEHHNPEETSSFLGGSPNSHGLEASDFYSLER